LLITVKSCEIVSELLTHMQENMFESNTASV